MRIVKYTHLSAEISDKFTNVLINGFKRNKFIFNYLMGGNEKTIFKFMKMIVEYNNHYADYYALINDEDKWTAVVVYLPEGCEPLGLNSAIKRRKLFSIINFFLTQPAKYRKRMLKFSDFEDKNWYKEPFITLDLVASLEKGCGKTLIEKTITYYTGKNIALNCSVDNKNHSYYKQFGFDAYKEILFDNHKTVMMVKKA